MTKRSYRQAGASFIGTLVFLVLFAYAAFVGIQYVPQWLEFRAVKSILADMEQSQGHDQVATVEAARAKLIRMLQINDMNDLTDSFEVSRSRGAVVIDFNYERELNLGYETRTMHYHESVRL